MAKETKGNNSILKRTLPFFSKGKSKLDKHSKSSPALLKIPDLIQNPSLLSKNNHLSTSIYNNTDFGNEKIEQVVTNLPNNQFPELETQIKSLKIEDKIENEEKLNISSINKNYIINNSKDKTDSIFPKEEIHSENSSPISNNFNLFSGDQKSSNKSYESINYKDISSNEKNKLSNDYNKLNKRKSVSWSPIIDDTYSDIHSYVYPNNESIIKSYIQPILINKNDSTKRSQAEEILSGLSISDSESESNEDVIPDSENELNDEGVSSNDESNIMNLDTKEIDHLINESPMSFQNIELPSPTRTLSKLENMRMEKNLKKLELRNKSNSKDSLLSRENLSPIYEIDTFNDIFESSTIPPPKLSNSNFSLLEIKSDSSNEPKLYNKEYESIILNELDRIKKLKQDEASQSSTIDKNSIIESHKLSIDQCNLLSEDTFHDLSKIYSLPKSQDSPIFQDSSKPQELKPQNTPKSQYSPNFQETTKLHSSPKFHSPTQSKITQSPYQDNNNINYHSSQHLNSNLSSQKENLSQLRKIILSTEVQPNHELFYQDDDYRLQSLGIDKITPPKLIYKYKSPDYVFVEIYKTELYRRYFELHCIESHLFSYLQNIEERTFFEASTLTENLLKSAALKKEFSYDEIHSRYQKLWRRSYLWFKTHMTTLIRHSHLGIKMIELMDDLIYCIDQCVSENYNETTMNDVESQYKLLNSQRNKDPKKYFTKPIYSKHISSIIVRSLLNITERENSTISREEELRIQSPYNNPIKFSSPEVGPIEARNSPAANSFQISSPNDKFHYKVIQNSDSIEPQIYSPIQNVNSIQALASSPNYLHTYSLDESSSSYQYLNPKKFSPTHAPINETISRQNRSSFNSPTKQFQYLTTLNAHSLNDQNNYSHSSSLNHLETSFDNIDNLNSIDKYQFRSTLRPTQQFTTNENRKSLNIVDKSGALLDFSKIDKSNYLISPRSSPNYTYRLSQGKALLPKFSIEGLEYYPSPRETLQKSYDAFKSMYKNPFL